MTWGTATNIREGDEVRSDLDGQDYMIERIVHSMVILKSKDGEEEIITGIDSLRTFYKKKEKPNPLPTLPKNSPPYRSENS